MPQKESLILDDIPTGPPDLIGESWINRKDTLYSDYLHNGPDLIGESWINRLSILPSEIRKSLDNSPSFQRYVSLSILSVRPDDIDPSDNTNISNYVVSGQASLDASLNSNFWQDFQNGAFIHPVAYFKDKETILTAELKIRTLLFTLLQNIRGYGYSVESLAEKFMRTGSLEEKATSDGDNVQIRFKDDVSFQNVDFFLKRSDGQIFNPGRQRNQYFNPTDLSDWLPLLEAKNLFTKDDKKLLQKELERKKQPIGNNEEKLFIRLPNGIIYVPEEKLQQQAQYWPPNNWLNAIESYLTKLYENDENFLAEEFKAGKQPFARIKFDLEKHTPWNALPNWGVNLKILSNEEILSLANGAYCEPSCATYHSHVTNQKALGELIAPVDSALFSEKLLETYNSWKKEDLPGRFSVLIPAQADETTIGGILDYLALKGVDSDELKKNFSLVLADLCPTPLLRVYAHLKERGLLDISNITSSNVFNWGGPLEQKFHFIGTDHFVDLFPSDGEYNQRRVISSLTKALTQGGKLILTVRCGTQGYDLTKDKTMEEFYSNCIMTLRKLADELTTADKIPGEKLSSAYKKLFPTKQDLARGIYALISYLALRDVNPFPSMDNLEVLLSEINEKFKENNETGFSFRVSPIEGRINKSYIEINRS